MQAGLFDCDMFVFCASKGVPPVGAARRRQDGTAGGKQTAGMDVQQTWLFPAGFRGIFAVVSDPVDPLCKVSSVCQVSAPEQVQGYGLGVMHGRASLLLRHMDERMAHVSGLRRQSLRALMVRIL